ncbi:hypothetical protein PspLS_07381 [Pyricularia sp. CBS 133598]|nr:hypothetical protein PspLS_07381 [Pyricularia sp. CBS 133598]
MDVVLDFDGTIIAKDSINCLGEFGVSHQQKRRRHDLTSTWQQIVSDYLADHKKHVSAYSPAEADRLTHDDERAFLHSLQHVDVKSLARVADSRLFEGCTATDLYGAGQEAVRTGKVAARGGFAEFVAAMRGAGASLSILSVNWSASFIRGVLSQCGGVVIDDVVSNEITADGKIGCLGDGDEAGTPMMTSLHKLQALRARSAAPSSEDETGPRTTIYFGDSTTDLECLLAADIGIVMANDENSSLLRALARLGFDTPHALDATSRPQHVPTTVGTRRRLAWAKSFTEVLESGILHPKEASRS